MIFIFLSKLRKTIQKQRASKSQQQPNTYLAHLQPNPCKDDIRCEILYINNNNYYYNYKYVKLLICITICLFFRPMTLS